MHCKNPRRSMPSLLMLSRIKSAMMSFLLRRAWAVECLPHAAFEM
jgi:hypothetical protein